LSSFRDLSNQSSWSASYNAEAWNNHVGWDDCSLYDPHEVFDDDELANDAAGADMDMITYECSFDNGRLANEYMVANFERVM
jgi:hypothetical protein